MRRLTALAALAAALAACGSGSQQTSSRASRSASTKDPFRLTLLRDGEAVVTPGSRRAAALPASLDGRPAQADEGHLVAGDRLGRHTCYEVATDEPGRTATVTVSRDAGRPPPVAALASRDGRAAGLRRLRDRRRTSTSSAAASAATTSTCAGQILQIKVAEPCTYAPVPFFASSAGWGLRAGDAEGSRRSRSPARPAAPAAGSATSRRAAFPPLEDRVEVCVKGARLDEDLYPGTFAQMLEAYEAQAGQPRVPPPSELELIKWRDVVSGPAEVLEDITRFQAAGIPLGWVLVDNPWETCNGHAHVRPARFPDPAGLIRQVHARGVRFMLWVSPKVICGAGYPPRRRARRRPSSRDARPAPAATSCASTRRGCASCVALGVDGVKGDRGDEVDLERVSPTLPEPPTRCCSPRAVLGVLPRGAGAIFRAGDDGLAERAARASGPATSRATGSGSSAAIRGGADRGDERLPRLGLGRRRLPLGRADRGGLRALGAARGRLAGDGGRRDRPERDAVGARRRGDARRCATRPSCTTSSSRTSTACSAAASRCCGRSATRYPDDPEAWRADLELLVGPDLLAAPVPGPGTTPSVYLPEGTWVDLYTGADGDAAAASSPARRR